MLAGGVHLPHARGWGVGLLQRLEDGIWRYVCLLAVFGLALTVFDRFPPPRLVFVVRVVLFVLNP